MKFGGIFFGDGGKCGRWQIVCCSLFVEVRVSRELRVCLVL